MCKDMQIGAQPQNLLFGCWGSGGICEVVSGVSDVEVRATFPLRLTVCPEGG